MATSNEERARRFVALLSEKAVRNGQAVPSWNHLPLAWQRTWTETVAAFLQELRHPPSADLRFDELDEDEEIRVSCENLTVRRRLKTYRQLYALGCRIDGIERAIEKLTAPRG